MSNNNDILNRRDRSLEQPALNKSIAKYRTVRTAKELPPRDSSVNTGFIGLFRIIFILLILIAVMRVTLGSTQVLTFSGFLNALQTAPSVDISWLRSFVEWGNSVANIPIIGWSLNFLVQTTSVAIYAATGAIQIITYAIWIFGYIF